MCYYWTIFRDTAYIDKVLFCLLFTVLYFYIKILRKTFTNYNILIATEFVLLHQIYDDLSNKCIIIDA